MAARHHADGSLTAYTADNTPFAVVDKAGVHGVDHENKVVRAITAAKEDTEIFPMVNNYRPDRTGVRCRRSATFCSDPDARANFIQQVDAFLAANTRYRGLTLDFQEIPPARSPATERWSQTLYNDFHPRNLRLYIKVPVGDSGFDLAFLADHSDGIVLMNYDQHQTATQPGPVAGQDWFANNLKRGSQGRSAREDHLRASAATATTGRLRSAAAPPTAAQGRRRRSRGRASRKPS